MQKLKEAADELAEKERLENLSRSAGRKRGFILLFSFFALLASATIQNKPLSILIVSLCILAAMVVFVRSLALLSNVSATNPGFIIIKIVTFFNLAILGIAFVVAILTSLNILSFSEHSEKLLADILISCVMVFAGAVSSKLPFNRHTGLRLPWTVQDEGTWNVAHRILGVISFPVSLSYLAAGLSFSNFEIVSLCAIAVWIGIPGTVSYLFFRKKFKNTSKSHY